MGSLIKLIKFIFYSVSDKTGVLWALQAPFSSLRAREGTGLSFNVVDLVFTGRMLLYENFVFGWIWRYQFTQCWPCISGLCPRRKGTYHLSETQIFSLIDRKLKLVDKKDNAAGLQIADLVVTPIGRWAMGKKAHEDWKIIKTKFRKDSKTGRIEGYGLIALPKD